MPAPQVAQIPLEQKKDDDNGEREDDADEPFGQHIKSARCGKAPRRRARRLLQRFPEQQHGEADPQANNNVRNKDPGVDEDAERSKQDERRVEACHLRSKHTATDGVSRQEESKRIDCQW